MTSVYIIEALYVTVNGINIGSDKDLSPVHHQAINSLAPGQFEWNFRYLIF